VFLFYHHNLTRKHSDTSNIETIVKYSIKEVL